MTATGGPPGRSSAGVNVRPTIGETPKTLKYSAETWTALTCCGGSPDHSVIASAPKSYKVNDTKTWFCRHAMNLGMEFEYPTPVRNWRPSFMIRSGCA